MYCSGCGQPINPSQPYCLNCGRAVPRVMPNVFVPGVNAPVSYFYTRVHRHLQAVSILWIAYGFWILLSWVLTMSFFAGFFGGFFGHHWHHGPFGEFPFGQTPWLAPLITVFVVGRTILSVATGLALVRRAPWARTLAIVVAFLTILKPFTGTALAIYTLWVLLPSPSAREYEQIAEP